MAVNVSWRALISSSLQRLPVLALPTSHNPIGHPGVQVLSQAMNDLCIDLHLIPKPPKNLPCSTCLLSKSTHQVPHTNYKRAEKPFELIHTDLSGKFSIPSIGKRLYYITFIDDKTRYT